MLRVQPCWPEACMLQDDAAEAEWHDVAALPQPLAFDHKEIVREAFQHLLGRPQGQSGAPLSTMQFWSSGWLAHQMPVAGICKCLFMQACAVS